MNSQHKIRRVLITGGAGFVGSALVELLLRESPEPAVAVLDNFTTGQHGFVPNHRNVRIFECDLRDREGVNHVFSEFRPEYVIHLAAIHFIPYCNRHPNEAVAVNIGGTQHVLDACSLHPPRGLVVASSAAVYPINDDFNREEDCLPKPTDIYGLTKWCNEEQVRLYAMQGTTRCAVGRISNVYGPRETNAHIVPEIIHQMLVGSGVLQLGNVTPKRDYIHVNDVARAFFKLAFDNKEVYRIFNIGTGKEYSVAELATVLSRISGVELTIETASDKVRKIDRPYLRSDISRAAREIDFVARYDIEEGLSDLWQWARENPEFAGLPFRRGNGR